MNYAQRIASPLVLSEAVLFTFHNNVLKVALVQRQRPPYVGAWSLPGGQARLGETTLGSLHRSVFDTAGIALGQDVNYIEQLYSYDTSSPDAQAHAISITYYGCSNDLSWDGSKKHTALFSLQELPRLPHTQLNTISYARNRLAAKLSYSNIAFALLPDIFTLNQLQTLYEAVIGRHFDKRNFRKKYLSLGLVKEVNNPTEQVLSTTLKHYTFVNHSLEVTSRSFI